MKNGILRQPLSVTLVIFTLLAGLFWCRHLMVSLAAEAAVANPMPWGAAIAGWLTVYPYLEALASLLFIYLSALSLTRLVSRNLVFPARTHIFLILFIITGYGLYIRSGNVPAVAAGYLLIRSSEFFASAFRRNARLSDSFRGALLLGIVPLLYAPTAVYLLLLPVAMPVYMRGPRESLIALIAMLFPTLAYSYVCWGMGEPFLQFYETLFGTLLADGGGLMQLDMRSVPGILRLATGGLVAVSALISLGSFIASARQIRTRAYRIYVYMIFFLIIGVSGAFLPCASIGDLPLLALPVSIAGSFFFSRSEGLFASLLYLLTIIAVVVYNLSIWVL